MRPLIVICALLAAGCCPTPVTPRPQIVEVTRLVVEPVPGELLREHPIAEGALSACPAVAAERKAELLACNADKAALRVMQEENE